MGPQWKSSYPASKLFKQVSLWVRCGNVKVLLGLKVREVSVVSAVEMPSIDFRIIGVRGAPCLGSGPVQS